MLSSQRHLVSLPDDLHYLNGAYMSPLLYSVEAAGLAGLQLKRVPTDLGPASFFEGADRVRRAMNVTMEDQRAPDLPELTLGLFRDLKRAFGNKSGRVFMFPSSGTGAWESAIQNTLAPGDRVLMSRFGQFSHLWVEMAERLGLNVDLVDVEWGMGVPLNAYEEKIAADTAHEIRAVFVTHNETATGVTSSIAGVRKLLDAHSHPALLFVDGVSSIASIDFRQDEWGVDLAVAGSQKGFMLPAGLSFLSVSEKALAANRDNRPKMARSYFTFADQIATNDQGYFPYTPPTQFFHGLRAALDMLFERRAKRREDRADEDEGHDDDPSVFPLAIPLIAGPGSIATIILLVGQTEGTAGYFAVMGVLLAVFVLVFVLFLGATAIERLLGKTGITVITRLLGMLLAALSVQFVLDGLSSFGLGS